MSDSDDNGSDYQESEVEEPPPSDDEDEDEDYPKTGHSSGSKKKYVTGEERLTDNMMTTKEYSRLVSTLAELYNRGLEVHPDLRDLIIEKNIFDPLDLAVLHISMKQIPCPVTIERPINDMIEIWHRHEMILPSELEKYLIGG
jgi:hypothetical protein